MRNLAWLLVGLALGVVVYILAEHALTAAEREPALLMSRPPLVCSFEWVDADGDLVGTGCEVRP